MDLFFALKIRGAITTAGEEEKNLGMFSGENVV